MTEWPTNPTNPTKQELHGAKKFRELNEKSTYAQRRELMDPKYVEALELFAKDLEKACMRQATISDRAQATLTFTKDLYNVCGGMTAETDKIARDLNAHPFFEGCIIKIETISGDEYDDACIIATVTW